MPADSPAALDLITVNIGNTHSTAKGWSASGQSNDIATFTSDFRSMKTLAEYAATASEILISSVVRQCSAKLSADFATLHRTAKIFRLDVGAPILIVPSPAEKVGDDRIAAALGALSLDPASPWIVIDAGTAVTCNVVLPAPAGGVPRFEGGLIFPGATLCTRSLSQGAAQLSNLTTQAHNPDVFSFVGKNTEDAIRWGVMALQACALESIVTAQRALLKQPARVVITGGGAPFLLDILRQAGRTCDMLHEPDLVHRGLFACWKAAARPHTHALARD